MNLVRSLVVLLALIQGGWLAFDGSRALLTGDYTTRTTGPRARELGPWSRIVSAAGLEPRGSVMKGVHVVLGIAWLVSALALAVGSSSARRAVLACSIATLWYLPVGTLASVLVMGLVFMPSVRSNVETERRSSSSHPYLH